MSKRKKIVVGISIGLIVVVLFTGTMFFSTKNIEFKSAFSTDSRDFFSIHVNDQTSAPQQVIARAHLTASPNTIFNKMSDHRNLKDWVPMIDHLVTVDNSKSLTPGASNKGTSRICIFGGKKLVEDITHWIPGKAYAYSARSGNDSPISNHLAVITIEDDLKGGSYVTWRQYYKPVNFKGQYIMPIMMNYVLRKALQNLADEFGGVAA